MKSRFWKITDTVLILAVIAIGIWATRGFFASSAKNQSTDTSLSASNSAAPENNSSPEQPSFALISIDAGNGTKIESRVPVTANLSVLQALKLAAADKNISLSVKSYAGMGELVEKIGAVANGTGGAYWQFWVNNKYSDKGADQTIIKSGDRVDWKFTSSTENQ